MPNTLESRARRVGAYSGLGLALTAGLGLGCTGSRDHMAAGGSSDDGSSEGGVETSSTGTGAEIPACVVESREPVRRLSAFEYTRAVSDLVGVEIDEAGLPPSSVTTVFATEDAALGSSALLVDGQFDATVVVAQAVLARLQAGESAAFMGCAAIDSACVDTWIAGFGKRAYRRPLAEGERARIRGLYDEVAAVDGVEVAVSATVQALLLSPRFGFHVEEQTADGTPDDYAIASRISFFLWASMPDDELLAAADRGALADSTERAAQAQRLLADPRAAARVARAYRELLGLDVITTIEPLDPRWSEALREELGAETDRFVAATFFEHEGTLAGLFTSRWVDAGPELRALYGLGAAPGEAELPPERAGLLTRAAFLASTSRGASPSPILRGLAVLDRVMCTAPAPPPASVPQAPAAEGGVTNRDRFEQHTADAACASCHQQIDPIGFAFEGFDAIGAYRTVDNGQPIDASGAVLGTDVVGAAELSAVLAHSDVVASCAVTQWLRSTLGHPLREGEACARDQLAAEFVAGGGDIQDLLVDVAASPLFVQ